MESNFIEDERTTIEVIAFVSNPGPVHVLGHFSCIGDPEKKTPKMWTGPALDALVSAWVRSL